MHWWQERHHATIDTGAPPLVEMTATRRLTRSAAIAGRRSYCPSAQRYSMFTFRPSTNLLSLRPWRKGTKNGLVSGTQIANHGYCLLRLHRQRQGRHAPELCNEFAPSDHQQISAALIGEQA
jgi:hypothetical protein